MAEHVPQSRLVAHRVDEMRGEEARRWSSREWSRSRQQGAFHLNSEKMWDAAWYDVARETE